MSLSDFSPHWGPIPVARAYRRYQYRAPLRQVVISDLLNFLVVAPGPADSSLDSQSRIEDLDQALGEGQSNPTKTAPLNGVLYFPELGTRQLFCFATSNSFSATSDNI